MLRRNRQPSSTSSGSGAETMRALVYGDCALDDWPSGDTADQGEPWDSFVEARTALQQGNVDASRQVWLGITTMPDIESRHVLQAWHFLRLHGVEPPDDEARQVLGGVVEVPVAGKHDLLAAYADGSVRYLNHGGDVAAVEPSADLPKVSQLIGIYLAMADNIARVAGTWDQPSLPPVPPGHGRVMALTPGGLRFGQGPEEQLRAQQMPRDMLDAATLLLQQVVAAST